MSPQRNDVIEAVFEIPSDPCVTACFELPKEPCISAIFEINTYIDAETAEEFLEEYIYPLRDGLANEIERSTRVDEELSDEIDGLADEIDALDVRVENVEAEVAHKIDDVIGGPLFDVERDGNTVTINSKTFEFEQGIASDTWVIEHNLNKKPSVNVVDSSGSVQVPNEIIYDTSNKVTVLFLAAFKGKAFLN